MSYTTHELAKKLLELPDEEVFIQSLNNGLYQIKSVELCKCEAEAIITMEEI